ncbi:uncharacterized protein LOC144631685 [Oculina patagonica]
MNLENILFDREQLKEYVLDYLQKHHGYGQVEKTTTNGKKHGSTFSNKKKQSTNHHHGRLESLQISRINAKHKHLHHHVNEKHKKDQSLYLEHSTTKRQKIVSKQKSRQQSHSQHDHVEKKQRSKMVSLPIYYSVKEDDGRRSYIWSNPQSSSHKAKKKTFKKGGKNSVHDKEISRKKDGRVKHLNHEVHQKVSKHKSNANKLSSMRAFPHSHLHGELAYKKDTGHKRQTKKKKDKSNDAKKGENEGKHSGRNKEISGTKRSARVKDDHKIHHKARKHEMNANKLSSLRALPYSRHHGESTNKKDTRVKHKDKTKQKGNKDHKATNSLAHKKSNKRDFIAVVPPKSLRIEGFDVERVHPHSSHNKKKTTVTERNTHTIHGKKSKSQKKSGEKTDESKRNIASRSNRRIHHVKNDGVRKKSQLQKAGRKSAVASKSHRNDNHGKKGRVQKEFQAQKAKRKSAVVSKTSSERNKGSVHKSSREQNASKKSSVGSPSYRSHSHKHKHHDHGHKKSTVQKEEKSTAHKRKKTSRDKDSQKFSPTWKSLDKREIPAWYDDAKFGIFVHWGLYSVPSFDSEWFWFKWKGKQMPKYLNYTEKNFPPGFSYNEFAPMFKAEFFDAKQWAELVAISGARYFVFTSKHHEGFTNWNSSVAWNWNSVDIGPHRNIVDELARAFRNLSDPQVRFGLYYSLFEWFNPHYLKDKANGFKTDEYIQAVVKPQLYDLVNTYKPDYLWTDGEWEANATYWKSEEFLTWLFNESPIKDTVVVNDRWGRGCRCNHGGVYTGHDRYNPGKLQKMKWENAMTIDRHSWGFRREANLKDYFTIEELIKQLATTVSCGGNLLMNVGPASDGTITPIFQERLTQMGDWLKVNGDAIYKTRPWRAQNDSVSGDVWYTSKDSHVFAIALKWPRSGRLVLGDVTPTSKTRVKMLGTKKNLKWTHRSEHKNEKTGIVIHVPAIPVSELPCLWAWVFKFSHIK